MTTDASREAFEKWAKEEGYDTAHTYDTDRSHWIWLNPMTADLWESWQAAMAHKEAERWIPVTERLPEDGQQVWVVMRWAAEKALHDYPNQGYAIWSDGDWFFDLTEYGDLYSRQQAIKDNLDAAEIAAWMPLPAAPLQQGG